MSSVKIAAGHNNAAGLTFLEDLSGTLFELYAPAESLLTEWGDFETRILAGDRTYVNVGRPWSAWIFEWLTRAEMAYLRSTFSSSLVTIRTLNKATNAYANYNAYLVFPELGEADYDSGVWESVRFEFKDLEAL